jgi:signal peptidase I
MEDAMTQKIWAYLRKRSRSLGLSLLVAICVAIPVRLVIAQSFRAVSDAASPEIPRGSFVLVYKLAGEYQAGDIVLYQDGPTAMLGRVVAVQAAGLRVARKGEEVRMVPRTALIGRAVLNTR